MSVIAERAGLQLQYFAKCITEKSGYTAFFKGGVFLLIACVIAIRYVSDTTLPIEESAYQLKFEVEHSIGQAVESFDALECNVTHNSYVACEMAKYKRELSSSTLDALYTWLELLLSLSYIMIFMSFIGFAFHPHFHHEEN